MPELKLIALDVDDLGVLSAHLQDAAVKVGDMAFLPRERRFALVANRFDWIDQADGNVRRRSGVRLERVLAAQVTGLDLMQADQTLALLAVAYEPVAGSEPEGYVTLQFSGGAAVRLRVECIEAELKDLGAAWTTARRPTHEE